MTCHLEYDQLPSLPNSILLAAWPGMGYVAYRAANFLVQALEAKEFATLKGTDLFPLESVMVRDGLLQPPQNPLNRFYYVDRQENGRDLVIFLGESQPVSGKGRELAGAVLDIAEKTGCSLVVTFAAYATHISHTQQHAVWAASSEPSLNRELGKYDIKIMPEGNISGLNGTLLAVAHERGFRSTCLLGEIPLYALQIEYPKASLVILEKFKEISEIDLDLKNLVTLTGSTARQIDGYLAQLRNIGELSPGIPDDGDDPEIQTLH